MNVRKQSTHDVDGRREDDGLAPDRKAVLPVRPHDERPVRKPLDRGRPRSGNDPDLFCQRANQRRPRDRETRPPAPVVVHAVIEDHVGRVVALEVRVQGLFEKGRVPFFSQDGRGQFSKGRARRRAVLARIAHAPREIGERLPAKDLHAKTVFRDAEFAQEAAQSPIARAADARAAHDGNAAKPRHARAAADGLLGLENHDVVGAGIDQPLGGVQTRDAAADDADHNNLLSIINK